MKKFNITLFVIVSLFSMSGFSINTDSIGVKKSFQTIEICGGISPKAYRKYVTSSKGYIMYGLWYDYSRKIKNNFYASFIVNPLVGGNEFYDENYNEDYSSTGFFSLKAKEKYLLLNMGVGIKYKLNLSKSNLQKHFLIFAAGDCLSYKYIYNWTSVQTTTTYSPPFSHTGFYSAKYNLWNHFNQFDMNEIAFPMFLKLSYCQKRITFSLTQYLFAQESIYGSGYFERFYTNFNIGVTL